MPVTRYIEPPRTSSSTQRQKQRTPPYRPLSALPSVRLAADRSADLRGAADERAGQLACQVQELDTSGQKPLNGQGFLVIGLSEGDLAQLHGVGLPAPLVGQRLCDAELLLGDG